MVEFCNSQRPREFAEGKKTLTKARALLSAGSVVPPGPAMPGMAAPAEAAPAEIASAAQPEETKGREEEIGSGMHKEIQNLLRYSAGGGALAASGSSGKGEHDGHGAPRTAGEQDGEWPQAVSQRE